MEFGVDFGSAIAGPLGLIGSIYGANQSASSASEANMMNYLINKENNKFNAEQAEIARDWSERMSNTSYQRARSDLLAAGYNPILAINNGGASSPAASYASSAGSAHMSPADYSALSHLGSGFQSVAKLDKIRFDLDKKSKEVEIGKTKQDTETSRKIGDAAETRATADLVGKIAAGGSAAVSAYAAKKSADVAIAAMSKGATKESAKSFARDVVGKSPATSAVSSSSVFMDALKALGFIAPFAFGVSNDVKTSKKLSGKDFKDLSNIRASGYGY